MGKMNLMDRAIAAVAPEHALRRAVARESLRFINSGYGNYGASTTKKSMRGWQFAGGSAKEDIEDNLKTLRERSRDAYMGVPIATGALKTLRTNVVAGGLTPSPQIDADFLGMTPEQANDLQMQIIREFSLWADSPLCDADRMDNFYKLQQLACFANCKQSCANSCEGDCNSHCGAQCTDNCDGGCSGCSGSCSGGCTSCSGFLWK